MDIHTATEVAYKNGYEKGYAEGKAEVARKVAKWLTKKAFPNDGCRAELCVLGDVDSSTREMAGGTDEKT
jgi:hypothetical protein